MKQEIEVLQLSVRSANCLRQEQIDYIDDLVVLNELDLYRIPNMGKKSVNEIIKKLREIGLSLSMETSYTLNNENSYIKNEQSEINIWLDNIATIQPKQAKLNNALFYIIGNLSVRSKNALNLELTHHNNIIELGTVPDNA